jgi:choline dehydrogenase-like flavoprotein
MGISVKVDSPGVGKNLQSHVGTGDVIFTLKDPVSFNAFRLYLNPLNILDYFIRRKGPLSGVSGFDGMGNIRVNSKLNSSSSKSLYPSGHNIEEPDWPDVQITMLSIHVGKLKNDPVQLTIRSY